ncbi:MAG TPA: hypothetical protein DCR97_00870 [Deltaproteobacteria bacterium]|nr:hypothetical protein [Deltaproteobacteria bacterium]
MTHEDFGKYAEKRQGSKLNETIAAAIREKISGQTISCADAHNIAEKLNVTPEEVGTAVDLLELRIVKCQLGLFQQEKSVPSGETTPEIESAIKSSLTDGRLTCLAAWEIAKKLKVSRVSVGAACETMKIKISLCQLGTFK